MVEYIYFKYRIREGIRSIGHQLNRKRRILLSETYGSYSQGIRIKGATRRR